MWDIALSALLIAAILYLVYELRRFGVLHAKKYEVPTEKIWEKFVGIRPEDLSDANLAEHVQGIEGKLIDIQHRLEKNDRLTRKLIEELGK